MIGHLPNPIINASFAKGAGLFNSAVVIDEAVILSALKSGISFDSMTQLMSYVHNMEQFSISQGKVKLLISNLLLTIEYGDSINKVILIESA